MIKQEALLIAEAVWLADINSRNYPFQPKLLFADGSFLNLNAWSLLCLLACNLIMSHTAVLHYKACWYTHK